MINIWHLIWIIPVTASFSFLIFAILTVGKGEDDWTSVEISPEEEGFYLTYHSSQGDEYITDERYHDGHWSGWDITHWKPLSTSPKGVEQW